MPVYSYLCTACGHQFEERQAFSDPALHICPQCEGKLRKVFNTVGIVFKGSGFYRNDSRDSVRTGKNGSGRENRKGDSSADTKTGSADTKIGSSETKTASSETGSSATGGKGSDSTDSSPSAGNGNPSKGSKEARSAAGSGSRDSSRTAAPTSGR